MSLQGEASITGKRLIASGGEAARKPLLGNPSVPTLRLDEVLWHLSHGADDEHRPSLDNLRSEWGGGGVATPVRSSEIVVDEVVDDGDTDYTNGQWFCLQRSPYRGKNCGCLLNFISVGIPANGFRIHKIIVWPDKDDPNLLRVASRLKELNLDNNPRIVEYAPDFGPSLSYYVWSRHKDQSIVD